MKKKITHIFISIALITSLLLPVLVGFSEVLHFHKHQICNANNEKHVHKTKLSCSHTYFISNSQVSNKEFVYKLFIPVFYLNNQSKSIKIYSSYIFSELLSRGPPKFMFI